MGMESSKISKNLDRKQTNIFQNKYTDLEDTHETVPITREMEVKYGMNSHINLQNCSNIKLISTIKAATNKNLDLKYFTEKQRYPALYKFKSPTKPLSNKVSIHKKGFTTEKIESERFLIPPRRCPKLVKTISSTEFDQCLYSLSSSSTNEIVEEYGVEVYSEEGLNDEDSEVSLGRQDGKEYRKKHSIKSAMKPKGPYSDMAGSGKRLTPLLFSQSSISNEICHDINKPYYVKTSGL